MPMIDVMGNCPMGCGRTLHLNPDGGMIACLNKECPRPLAVTDLLVKVTTDHLVEIGPLGFTIKHPLLERIDDKLFDCPLGTWLEALDGPPVSAGLYRVRKQGHDLSNAITSRADGKILQVMIDGWMFEEIEGEL